MGDTMQFSKLAETLEIIAKEGVKAFYTGRIGLDLIQDIKDAGWCKIGLGKLRLCHLIM